MDDDLLLRPAREVARQLLGKSISARELTEMLFARIEALNPELNAVVELRREAALDDAARADAEIFRGGELGPLHGVPMTIKESFHVAGMHTTWGNPAFREYVADWDATVVRRLRRAGAIIVGKSNVAAMLGDYAQTSNELYGVTNNPWDHARAPGGSTGGGAAATAVGMTFLEYGTDLVGSIRIPASFCGVYGLRPSVDTVPTTGMQPPGPPAGPSDMLYLSAVGPLARSAADLRTALRVTAGPEHPAANAYSWNLAPPRHRRLRDFRVGFVLDHQRSPVSSEVGAVLSNVIGSLAAAGITVVEGWPAGVDSVEQYETFGFHLQLFFAYQQADPDPTPLTEFVARERARMAARAVWTRYFDDVDVFLCPVNFTPAIPHDSRPFEARTVATPEGQRHYDDQPFWTSFATLAGLPAVAAPVGSTPGGLPVGAQIIGPIFEDDTAITFAELLAEVTGGYRRPPVTRPPGAG